jgi:hypothetical protein
MLSRETSTPNSSLSDSMSKINVVDAEEGGEDEVVETSSNNLVLDIMSVGSKTRIEYMQAQKSTFGVHEAIRNFFAITEDDDFEQNCSVELTAEDASQITQFCLDEERTEVVARDHPVLAQMRPYFNEKNPDKGGWICAQKRPIDALSQIMELYEKETPLPDYLLIVDDDTYLAMPEVHQYLKEATNSADPVVMAGCFDRWDDSLGQPWGGWGTFISKAALINLRRPIDCNQISHDPFAADACRHINNDKFGEKRVFRNGMTIGELMQAYVSVDKFADFKTWSDQGYSVQSDWVWGYFFNFYPVSTFGKEPVVIDGIE